MNFMLSLTILSLLLSLAALVPAVTALWGGAAHGAERGIAYLLMLAGVLLLSREFRSDRSREWRVPLFGEKNASLRRGMLLTLLPALPFLLSLAWFTLDSYRSLYLGDQDFTNISSAINSLARARGLFTTPFVDTGSRGSFLGHHFSWSLVLFVPFQWGVTALWSLLSLFGAGPPTHFVYGILLFLTLLSALPLWYLVLRERLSSPVLLLLCGALLWNSLPLWRLALSFHFEVLVFPLSALFFLGERRRSDPLFWSALLLWLGVKEDMGLYLFFYGLHALMNSSPERSFLRRRAPWMMALSLLYFLAASGPLFWFSSGGESLRWVHYWTGEGSRIALLSIKSLFVLLLSLGLLPLLAPRLFLFTILPVALTHLFSHHPWHATYYGHYSYTLAPFLWWGTVSGMERLQHSLNRRLPARVDAPLAAALLTLALGYVAASGEKESPPPPWKSDARLEEVESLLASLPRGACVQTQIPFTPHVPLHARVFPLRLPLSSPFRQWKGPLTAERAEFSDSVPCRGFFLLLDPADPRPPHYTQEDLKRKEEWAQNHLILLPPSGRLHLYGNRRGLENLVVKGRKAKKDSVRAYPR